MTKLSIYISDSVAKLAILFGFFFSNFAHAELMLYPTRVVIEDRQRGGHVEMINRSQETQTFRIGLYNGRMTEIGRAHV